jgi:hypothetical protein
MAARAALAAPWLIVLGRMYGISPPACCHYILEGGDISKNSAKIKNSVQHALDTYKALLVDVWSRP